MIIFILCFSPAFAVYLAPRHALQYSSRRYSLPVLTVGVFICFSPCLLVWHAALNFDSRSGFLSPSPLSLQLLFRSQRLSFSLFISSICVCVDSLPTFPGFFFCWPRPRAPLERRRRPDACARGWDRWSMGNIICVTWSAVQHHDQGLQWSLSTMDSSGPLGRVENTTHLKGIRLMAAWPL